MISSFILEHFRNIVITFGIGILIVIILMAISALPSLTGTRFANFFEKLDEIVTVLLPILGITLWIMILLIGYYWSYLM
ncbi:MAG: hypothetical protein N5837_04745 [Lactobacillus crispatus]|nr:hypothetical protein [Lactobacillus crispatus]